MSNICYIIIIGNEKPQMWFAELNVKNTSKSSKLYRCVFLLVYSLLLIIIANAIIRAKAMIVVITSEKNNMYIIFNNVNSTIRLTSLLEANHICLFSFPIANSIVYFYSFVYQKSKILYFLYIKKLSKLLIIFQTYI